MKLSFLAWILEMLFIHIPTFAQILLLFLLIEINGSYYRNNKQTATTQKSSAMDYSSDEKISEELGDRPPTELESPSKIQKSPLLLESTGERTAVKDFLFPSKEDLENLQRPFSASFISNNVEIKQQYSQVNETQKHGESTLKILAKHLHFLILQANSMKDYSVAPQILLSSNFTNKKTAFQGFYIFLEKVLNEPLMSILSSANFQSALNELVESFKQRINTLLQHLPLETKLLYKNIGALTEEKIGFAKKQAIKVQRGFSEEALVRMDILSLFFYCNLSFEKLAQRSRIISLIPRTTLLKIFGFNQKRMLVSYQRKFYLMSQILVFDYQEYFYKDITMICLLHLKYRLSNGLYNQKLKQTINFKEEQVFRPDQIIFRSITSKKQILLYIFTLQRPFFLSFYQFGRSTGALCCIQMTILQLSLKLLLDPTKFACYIDQHAQCSPNIMQSLVLPIKGNAYTFTATYYLYFLWVYVIFQYSTLKWLILQYKWRNYCIMMIVFSHSLTQKQFPKEPGTNLKMIGYCSQPKSILRVRKIFFGRKNHILLVDHNAIIEIQQSTRSSLSIRTQLSP